MLAVQPNPEGANDSTVTFSTSPGSAPSMYTGPVTGLTLLKSSALTLSTVEPSPSWPAEESEHSKWMVEPGRATSEGAKSRFQPK